LRDVLHVQLSAAASEDYAAWVVGEYYRYVEIATFIPLGAIAGVIAMILGLAIFLIRDMANTKSAGFTTVHGALLVLAILLAVVTSYVWSEIWMKRVVEPCIRTYLVAKRNLIAGVKAVDGLGIKTKGDDVLSGASPSIRK
jgi:uncharacterized membrane protein